MSQPASARSHEQPQPGQVPPWPEPEPGLPGAPQPTPELPPKPNPI